MRQSPVKIAVVSVIAGVHLQAAVAWAGGAGIYEMATPDMGTAAAGRAALAADASTAFSNPAGMTRLAGSEILLGLQPYQIQQFFDADRPPTNGSGGNGGKIGGFSPLPSWGGWAPGSGLFGVYGVTDAVKLGFSVNSYVGGAADYDDNWVGRYYVQRADLLTMNFNPSVAYRVTPWLSVGAGFSVQYAKIVQKAAINNSLDRLGDGRITVRDDNVGFGGNAGVLLEPIAGTRVGLTYRSPVDQDFTNVATLENIGPLLQLALSRSGLLGKPVDMSVTIPQEVMLSGFHQLTREVAILGNFGWQNWSAFGKPVLTVSNTSVTANQSYDDTFHGAVGLQVRVAEPWLVSAGFAYDTSAVDYEHRTPDFAVDAQYRYALGLQYDWTDAVTLGVAYEFLYAGTAPINQQGRPIAGTLVGDYSTYLVNFVNFNVIVRL